ncbi:MAG: protein jag [Deltaproteobacteria bacterium]|nr:protein jag [Deltaproteobacteria bacterium]MBW2024671.1 protein jag [Deltaproteobacteria bacterium]MBW2124682.1 protein jag [Deltaproteobacteria bacterium]
MEQFEFEGKTTEEAIEKACKELNKSREEMDIEIIEPGSAGIFSIVGTKKAKIRVTIETEEETTEEDELAFAKKTLEDILSLIPMEAKVTAANEDGKVILNIEGDKSGLLIGRKGKNLDALQFIVNKIVNRSLSKKVQVVVDAENYRQRRRDALIQMALKMGDKAKRIKKPVMTNPLTPRERRIIHLALKDDAELDTKSRGEGLLKKVLIIPKKS